MKLGIKIFPYLLKKENQIISNVLKGCKKRPVTSNSLRISTLRITNIFLKENLTKPKNVSMLLCKQYD